MRFENGIEKDSVKIFPPNWKSDKIYSYEQIFTV